MEDKHQVTVEWTDPALLYAALAIHGTKFFGDYVADTFDRARRFAERLAREPDFEVAIPPQCNIVCFRHAVPGLDEEGLASFNRELLMRLQERGAAVPSHTTLGGKFALRACITNGCRTPFLPSAASPPKPLPPSKRAAKP